jgi:DNA-directed RNA polymerase subunit RPC12/RpoP
MKYHDSSFADFKCMHCHAIVSVAHTFSGVNNRNHCPYCLWSCHLDLFKAGDRLSACKGQMRPIGLTMKKGRNKYRLGSGGELMLIHICVDCGSLSINRLAADDDPDSVIQAFHAADALDRQTRAECESQGITILENPLSVYNQLYGESEPIRSMEYA